MGTVISFPDAGATRGKPVIGERRQSATVIILPVIRIERFDEPPRDIAAGSGATRRRRRRRSSQS